VLYGILKVVHVIAVVLWIGGGAALAMLTAPLLRARDRAGLATLLPQMARFGPTIGGPSSLLVLLTGIAMVIVGRIGFETFWVSWGFAGILVHFVFGIVVMRKIGQRLAQAVGSGDDRLIAAAGGRWRLASAVYLLLMMSVIVVMVMKPTV
jgi:uncharacterized membrane protein